ncbi:MAG: hypothetical protein M3Y48_00180 [Actinomycetota bacterium]|nr:hypothetical protein [Actinomycetota bacterium]
MEDAELDRRLRALPERLAAREATPYRRATVVAFSAKYDLGGGLHGTVKVEVGAAPAGVGMYLVWLDQQFVEIDDPRVMFIVSGTVLEGRLADLRYSIKPGGPFLDRFGELLNSGLSGDEAFDAANAENLPSPTHEITQRDVRAMSTVSMIKNWAAVGRAFQDALKRYAADAGITYRSGYNPQGLHPDDATDPVELANALIEQTGILDRLFNSHNHAVSSVCDTFAKVATQPRRRRGASDDDENALVKRVVDEYKDAVARGVRAPRRVVAERLRYHDTHIGRLLAQARGLGMLPPAKPRGRRKPASAEG